MKSDEFVILLDINFVMCRYVKVKTDDKVETC